MKKNMFYTAAMLLAGAVMAACSGSEDIMGNTTPEPQAPTQQGAVVLSGTIGGRSAMMNAIGDDATGDADDQDNMTRAVASNGTGTWTVGDQFAVYYETANGHATAIATVNSVNDNGAANFTATLNAPKAGDSEVALVYPASAHDGNGGIKADALDEQDGTRATLGAKFDIETAETTLNVENDKATLNSDVNMVPQVCLYKLEIDKSTTCPLYMSKLEISDGTHIYTISGSEPFSAPYVALWPVSNANFSFVATEGIAYTKLDGVTLANCTSDNVGDVFDKDGNIYRASPTDNGVIWRANFSGITLESGKAYNMDGDPTEHFNMTAEGSNGIIAVAMIAYVANTAGTVDTSIGAEGYHGLAMSMFGCWSFNSTGWKPNTYVWQQWCTQTSEACTSHQSTDLTTALSWLDGISITNELVNHATHTHWAAKATAGYVAERPTGCSTWFIPSLGQWQLIYQGLITKEQNLSEPYPVAFYEYDGGTPLDPIFNPFLKNVGAAGMRGNGYYSCTECTSMKVWLFMPHFIGGCVLGDSSYYPSSNRKTLNRFLRPVLAF